MAKKSKKGRSSGEGQENASSLPKLKRKDFEKELYKLQVELTRLQAWAVREGTHQLCRWP